MKKISQFKNSAKLVWLVFILLNGCTNSATTIKSSTDLSTGDVDTPPKVDIVATPASINSGQSSTLSWTSSDATSCVGTGFSTNGLVSGSVSVTPTTTQTYSISCAGAGGIATDSTTITVTVLPLAGIELPGPSADLFAANPYYTCVANRYVATAANGGSDSNNGTQSTNLGGGNGPFLTIQKANDSLPANAAGYCINIGDGVYNVSTISINKGGNLASMTGFVVYRSRSLLGAKLVVSSSAWDTISVSTPYVIFDGLELSGARKGSGINTCFNGTNYNGVHHIMVMNSYIHDMGENGIATCWAEYYWMIHNQLDGNAYGSWNSGISTYEPMVIPGYNPTAYDNKWTPYHNVYVYNRCNKNFTSPAGGPHTDGNGIIYDDTQHTQNAPNIVYTPMALLMGNVSWSNGGAGIQIGPTSANADIFNNTAYNNYLDTYNTGTWRGELSSSGTMGVTFKNNAAYALPGAGILANNSPYLGGNPTGVNTWLNNIAFGASPYMDASNTFSSTTNKVNINPKFVNPAGGNFALCTGVGIPNASCTGPSPGIGYGAVVPYWQQRTPGSIDIGACPSGLTACP